MLLQTRNVRDVFPLASCSDAFHRGYGYIRHSSPELPDESLDLITYDDMKLKEWYNFVNSRRFEVPSIGCQLLPGAKVHGPGYVLHENKLIVEGNSLDDVLVDWASQSNATLRSKKEIPVHSMCIAFLGPGHLIYGHWIADFIPRLYAASLALGDYFAAIPVLWPDDTPRWAEDLVDLIFKRQVQKILYSVSSDCMNCSSLLVPTYPLSSDHHFHSCVKELYKPFRAVKSGDRRICISRSRIEGKTAGATKNFLNRRYFEGAAKTRGFEIIYPEELSFIEQISMYNSASIIIGEYGSAMHSSVFAPNGTVVAAVGCFNSIQSRIGSLFQHRCGYLIPDTHYDDGGVLTYSAPVASIEQFLDAVCAAPSRG